VPGARSNMVPRTASGCNPKGARGLWRSHCVGPAPRKEQLKAQALVAQWIEHRFPNRSRRVGLTGYTGPDEVVLAGEPVGEGPSGPRLAAIVAANVALTSRGLSACRLGSSPTYWTRHVPAPSVYLACCRACAGCMVSGRSASINPDGQPASRSPISASRPAGVSVRAARGPT
jgi:hypothetical protein